jgi:hypothetical protein
VEFEGGSEGAPLGRIRGANLGLVHGQRQTR